jgi:predicted DCC family thiol-disulfide oxidoreductase YuxK
VIPTSFSPEGRVAAALRSPTRLLVLYDAECALCVRCRHWLERQPTYVELDFLAASSPKALAELAEVRPWLGAELVVVSERGEAWLGAAGFLVCLWATQEYREWSYRLSGPALAPLAERFFHLISNRRDTIGQLLGPSTCEGGQCRHRR